MDQLQPQQPIAPLSSGIMNRHRKEAEVGHLTAKGERRKYVQHSYSDRSKDIIENITESDENTLRMYKEDSIGGTFPIKLQVVLKVIEKMGQGHIISWMPHGRSFMIHRPRQFEGEIMGKFFKQSKLTSFQRQLNLYDFQRITHGRDAGSYYHELFLRGRPLLSKRMIRRKVKGTRIRASSSPDEEPNFYTMPFMGPLRDDATPYDHHTVGAPGKACASFLSNGGGVVGGSTYAPTPAAPASNASTIASPASTSSGGGPRRSLIMSDGGAHANAFATRNRAGLSKAPTPSAASSSTSISTIAPPSSHLFPQGNKKTKVTRPHVLESNILQHHQNDPSSSSLFLSNPASSLLQSSTQSVPLNLLQSYYAGLGGPTGFAGNFPLHSAASAFTSGGNNPNLQNQAAYLNDHTNFLLLPTPVDVASLVYQGQNNPFILESSAGLPDIVQTARLAQQGRMFPSAGCDTPNAMSIINRQAALIERLQRQPHHEEGIRNGVARHQSQQDESDLLKNSTGASSLSSRVEESNLSRLSEVALSDSYKNHAQLLLQHKMKHHMS